METENVSSYDMLKLENQLCFPLYACSRRVTGKYTPYLKPLGLTYTQYLVFLVLWEQDDLSVGDLCRKLYLDSGTLTPVLKKMEDKGLLIRYRCPQDERCVKIKLTEEGRNMKDKAVGIPAKVGGCVRLSADEAAQLYKLLYKVLESVG